VSVQTGGFLPVNLATVNLATTWQWKVNNYVHNFCHSLESNAAMKLVSICVL